jgi:type I restriction enzyme S subunit
MVQVGVPEGWVKAPVGEICRLINGRAYSKDELLSEGKYHLLRVGNLFTNPYWYYSDLELEPDKYCDKGDLLYAWSASFGPHIWQGPKVIYHYHIWKIEHHEDLIARDFLRAFFQWDTEAIKREQGSGSTMLHVTKKSMEARLIPVPPRNEQAAIAAKLDTTLAAVDACRQRLDGVAAILKRFRQAVLAAATSGELTREWREENTKSLDDWSVRTVGDVVTDIEAGLSVQCEERPPAENERGLVKISAVTWGTYDEDESKTLKPDQQVMERNRIRPGDFLISRANTIELVGSCVIVHEARRALYLSDKVLRLVMPEEWKKWLLMCLRSDNGRRQIEGLSSGNQLSMRNLSQKNLLSIQIRLPPKDELDQIESVSNRFFSLADQLEAKLTAARRIVDRLTPALLAKAFRGELVPQDPNDEPASLLLERIRAARQEDAASGMPKRPRRRNAQTPRTNPKTFTNMLTRKDVPQNHLSAILLECGPLSAEALWSASQLEIDDFYDQLRDEEAKGFLRENSGDSSKSPRVLESVG